MTRKRDARDPVLVAIGDELRELVKATGKRQVDVAMESGIGLRTVAGYMAGGDVPLSALLRLAPVVGMRPEDLTTRLVAAAREAAPPDDPGLSTPVQSGDGLPPPLPEHVRRAVLDQEVLGETRPDRVVTRRRPSRGA